MKHTARHTSSSEYVGRWLPCAPCEKRGYADRRGAKRALRWMRQRGLDIQAQCRLGTYQCETGLWHVGNRRVGVSWNDPRVHFISHEERYR